MISFSYCGITKIQIKAQAKSTLIVPIKVLWNVKSFPERQKSCASSPVYLPYKQNN